MNKFIYAIDIKSWIRESWVTIYDARKFILFSFCLFSSSIILGYYYLGDVQIIRDSLIELYESFNNKSYLSFVIKIFMHNLVIAYISMRFGILGGLFPAISGIISGISIGWLFANIEGVYWAKILLNLAPHGLFELPAMIIAWGLGFWRLKIIFDPNYDKIVKENVRKIHKIFITIILPLLLLAALIEGVPLLFE